MRLHSRNHIQHNNNQHSHLQKKYITYFTSFVNTNRFSPWQNPEITLLALLYFHSHLSTDRHESCRLSLSCTDKVKTSRSVNILGGFTGNFLENLRIACAELKPDSASTAKLALAIVSLQTNLVFVYQLMLWSCNKGFFIFSCTDPKIII